MNLSRQNGFTLLEIVVAVGVFAVLTTLAYGGLNQVLNQSQQTREISQKLQDLQFAFALIQQDLSQMIPREVRDEYGNRQPALTTSLDESFLVKFTRQGWTNPAEQARSSLQRVSYILDEGQLQRSYWFELDRAPSSEPIIIPLLEDIESAELRFLDQKKEWQDGWPPAVATSGQQPPWPLAIEVTLETKRWGKVRRLLSMIDSPQNLPALGAPPAGSSGSGSGNGNGSDT